MQSNDHVCLCFRVSLGKIQTYLRREDPKVASLISECLGAGTGCGWCVPYLKHLHKQHQSLKDTPQAPTIEGTQQEYIEGRLRYKESGIRPEQSTDE